MSNDTGKRYAEQLTPLATGWAATLAAATVGLYAAGYLSLRCQLAALGVAAELHVIDERYFFAGASFLLYLLTVLPNLLIVVVAGGGLIWLAGRLLPSKLGEDIADRCRRWGAAWSEPRRLTVLGIVWALVAIQLVMRHVFYLDELLLGPLPCEPRWLVAVLYDAGGVLPPLYFAGLLVLVVVPALCLRTAWPHRCEPRLRLAVPLLAVLVAVQLLLLPVNHGVLTAGRGVPRLRTLPGEDAGSRVWRVWQGTASSICLVERSGKPAVRRLVVVPQAKMGSVEILRHEDLLNMLDAGRERPCGGS